MPTDDHRFALIGDSNSAGIGRVARSRGIPFLGGPLSNGITLDGDFFDVEDGDFLPRVDGPQAAGFTGLFKAGLPILSTVGFNTQRIAQELHHGFYRPRGLDHSALSDNVLRQAIEDYKPGTVKFYRAAVEQGCDVYAVYSPQRFPEPWMALALRLERLLSGMLVEMGVSLVDVRPETTDEAGRLRPEFFTERENDQTHASDVWSAMVLDRFLDDAGIGVMA